MYENVYYTPEKYGLELVVEVELAEPCYSFDTLAVWKNKDGQFYLGTDSGCSCPSPFESYNGIEDLTGPLTVAEAREEAKSLWEGSYEKYDPEGFAKALLMVV